MARWVSVLAGLFLSACNLALPLDRPAVDTTGDDAKVDTAITGCSRFSGVLRCDDFEDPWTSAYALYHGDDAAPPERVSPGQASGFALRASAGPAFGWSIVHLDLSPPVTAGLVSVRAYVNLSLDPVPTWVSVFQIFDIDVSGGTKAGFDMGPGDEAHVHCPSHGWLSTTGHPLAQGTWYCVELRVDLDANEVELWIDGALVEKCEASYVDLPAGGFTSVKVGVGTDRSKAEVTLDDVVVSRGPIGCP